METMRLRARATFHGQYGRIRGGEIFWSEPGYGAEMVRLGNAIHEPDTKPTPAPRRNQALAQAPSPKDPSMENAPAPSPPRTSDAPTAAGPERPASASRRGRRSPKRT